MRKDLKKRLENALMTLQEPRGSTVRSIIKVINKDSPALSLRKLLEALQEGINEGFLCMYNGRFKLKEQLRHFKDTDRHRHGSQENSSKKEKIKVNKESDSEAFSNSDSDDEDAPVFVSKYKNASTIIKKSPSKEIDGKRMFRKSQNRDSLRSKERKKARFAGKTSSPKKKSKKNKRKCSKESRKVQQESVLELNVMEDNNGRTSTEKPDARKQRGPRCTSMKKDVRMPSKVHIPFAPPPVVQRNSNFNDLLRQSPQPLNGPLFDNFILSGLFGTYC